MVSRRRSQLEITQLILELDLGNTRVKWRVNKNDEHIVERGVIDIPALLRGDFPAVWSSCIKRVRVASVLNQSIEEGIAKKLGAQFQFPIEFARASASCSGVVNAYSDATRLGVDRWLAIIAAYKIERRAALVVDIGTALKVDAVNDAGLHLGGYIVPGPVLMERALLEGTDRVRFDAADMLRTIAVGNDTRSCVQNGIAAALTGAVLVALGEIQNKLGKQPVIYITGGAGSLIKQQLVERKLSDVVLKPDLVLDGLRWVLP